MDSSSSSTCSSTTSNNTRKRRVRFDEGVRCRYIRPISSYTAKEIERCWLSEQEMAMIRLRAIERLEQIEAGDLPVERGLEGRFSSMLRFRNHLKVDAWTVVLDEQERQMNAGIHDPDRIAAVYESNARASLSRAILLGLLDQRDCFEAVHNRVAPLFSTSDEDDLSEGGKKMPSPPRIPAPDTSVLDQRTMVNAAA